MADLENLDPPTPTEDAVPAEGPGGIDAVPDWEAAGPDPVTPDQPQSAQVEDSEVPDEIKQPEPADSDDGEPADDSGDAGEDEPSG